MKSDNDKNTIGKLRWKLFKIRFKEFYEKYLCVVVFAVFDAVIGIYYDKKGRR